MPRSDEYPRRKIPREAAAWETRGGSGTATTLLASPLTTNSVLTDALNAKARVISDTNIALDNTTTAIDNVTLVDGDIVLVNAQGTASENGLYEVSTTGAWSRYRPEIHTDGLIVVVCEGDAVAVNTFDGKRDTVWMLVTDDDFEVGVDDIEFIQVPTHDSGQYNDTAATAYIVPPAGSIILAINGIDYPGIHHTQGGGTFTSDYSGSFHVGVSILGAPAVGGTMVSVYVYRNGVAYKEIIRDQWDGLTIDQRRYGACNLQITGDSNDSFDIRLFDGGGAGYTFNLAQVDVNVQLMERI